MDSCESHFETVPAIFADTPIFQLPDVNFVWPPFCQLQQHQLPDVQQHQNRSDAQQQHQGKSDVQQHQITFDQPGSFTQAAMDLVRCLQDGIGG